MRNIRIGKPLKETKLLMYREIESKIEKHIVEDNYFTTSKQTYVLREYMTLSLKTILSPAEQNKKAIYQAILDWKDTHIAQLIQCRQDIIAATDQAEISAAMNAVVLSPAPYIL